MFGSPSYNANMHVWTDKWTNRWTYGQTEGQMDGAMDSLKTQYLCLTCWEDIVIHAKGVLWKGKV